MTSPGVPRLARSWRSRLWVVLVIVGLAGVGWRWLVPMVADYLHMDLSTRDQVSSIASLWVSLVSLFLGVVGLVVRVRRGPAVAPLEESAVPVPRAAAGMASLAVPDLMSADRVRGRDELVADLVGLYRLRAGRAQRVRVLHGMGGSGKTTVAAQVAHHLKKRGVDVWWISARQATDLQTGMRLLARRLGATIAELDRDWPVNAPDVLWRLLAAHPRRWLLVVDNADDTRLLTLPGEPVTAGRGWIRPVPTAHGMLLVTTRDGDPATWISATGHDWPDQARGGWCQMHKVDMLTPGDGARVLLDHAGSRAGTVKEAAALARRLGGLPLALGLAGRYLADAERLLLPEAVTTFTGYQVALQTGGVPAVFDHPSGELTPIEGRQLIDRTWELSLDLLAERGLSQARTLLRLLALLDDAPIPYRLVSAQILGDSPLFPGLDVNQLRALLHALSSLGLIEPEGTGPFDASPSGTLRVHPLIRDVSIQHLHASDQYASSVDLAVTLIDNATTSDPTNPANWSTWRVVTPHALYLLITIVADTPDIGLGTVEQAARAARQAAHYLNAAGLYAAARDQAHVVHSTCQRLLGPEHPDTLSTWYPVARWIGDAGDPVAARDRLVAMLPIQERALGPEHPYTLSTRYAAARWIGDAGDPVVARDQLAVLLPIRERVLGVDHPDTLFTRYALARWVGEAGDPVGARDRLVELLPIQERVSGADHPDTLFTRYALAWWAGVAGDPIGARNQLAMLLPIRERVLGVDHPHTLSTRSALARWVGEVGDPAAARDQLTVLLPIQERVLGVDHPDTLYTRNAVAWWVGEAGDPVGARDRLIGLLPIRERVLGTDHPDTLSARGALAWWVGEAGDPVAARDWLAGLVPIRERVVGVDHPDTLSARYALAWWIGEAGDPVAARDQLTVLLPIRERVLGVDHPDTLYTRYALARWTGKAGDPVGARDRLAALGPIRERVLGADHPETQATRRELEYWRHQAGRS